MLPLISFHFNAWLKRSCPSFQFQSFMYHFWRESNGKLLTEMLMDGISALSSRRYFHRWLWLIINCGRICGRSKMKNYKSQASCGVMKRISSGHNWSKCDGTGILPKTLAASVEWKGAVKVSWQMKRGWRQRLWTQPSRVHRKCRWQGHVLFSPYAKACEAIRQAEGPKV